MDHAENVPKRCRKRSLLPSFACNAMSEEEYDALRRKTSQRGRAVDREVKRVMKATPPDISAPEGYAVIPNHDVSSSAGAKIKGHEVAAYNSMDKTWDVGVIESVNFRNKESGRYTIIVVQGAEQRGYDPRLVFLKK